MKTHESVAASIEPSASRNKAVAHPRRDRVDARAVEVVEANLRRAKVSIAWRAGHAGVERGVVRKSKWCRNDRKITSFEERTERRRSGGEGVCL